MNGRPTDVFRAFTALFLIDQVHKSCGGAGGRGIRCVKRTLVGKFHKET